MSQINFGKVQQLGRALMLPVAVLPLAGLLLRLGQPDVLNIKVIAEAGDAIFGNLPILFAIGVAVGFAKDNAGAAGLAGGLGYLVLAAILKTMEHVGADGKPEKLDMGVLGGIVIGITAGLLYNRYKDVKLPSYLAFFGGRRFVPIITGVVSVAQGIFFGYVWAPIQHVIFAIGQWAVDAGPVGVFLY
ncbi:MAG TPA: PTS transporter subunit EIIC, partial [Polyangiaceae bacterium]|nr:PTS transporter subunit EIIC [Polyangiaceae bacterium]